MIFSDKPSNPFLLLLSKSIASAFLSDSAELAEAIDIKRARAALERAEAASRGEHDATVESALRRAHARLSAAGGLTETRAAH